MPIDQILTGPELRTALTPNAQAVLGYWESLRGEAPFPSRQAFDPFAIPRQLPGIQLVQVRVDGESAGAAGTDEAISFVYRVVGTRETEARGLNPTGRPIEDGFFGGSAARVRQNYLRVFRTGQPLLDLEEVAVPAGYTVQDVSLFLPLAGDDRGDGVAQILVYSEQLPLSALPQG
jgi:hypothetical protein